MVLEDYTSCKSKFEGYPVMVKLPQSGIHSMTLEDAIKLFKSLAKTLSECIPEEDKPMKYFVGFLDNIGLLNSEYYVLYSQEEAIQCILEKGEGTEYEKHNPFEIIGD